MPIIHQNEVLVMLTYNWYSTLVIMAGGMGSRFGGLKQLEPVGPNGEAIIDYSIYDAFYVGFRHFVFIIRDEIALDFNNYVKDRFPDDVKISFAIQESPSEINSDRSKPWGTAHAILSSELKVDSSFAVINADDFYGRNAFEKAFSFLNRDGISPNTQAIIAFALSNTLSSNGSVSRGICKIDENKNLIKIQEVLNISKNENGDIKNEDELEKSHLLEPNTPVSMNLWCMQNSLFKHLKMGFSEFLKTNRFSLTAEFMIPDIIEKLNNEDIISVKVESTNGSCLGITYKEDKAIISDYILRLTKSGTYPSPLWK